MNRRSVTGGTTRPGTTRRTSPSPWTPVGTTRGRRGRTEERLGKTGNPTHTAPLRTHPGHYRRGPFATPRPHSGCSGTPVEWYPSCGRPPLPTERGVVSLLRAPAPTTRRGSVGTPSDSRPDRRVYGDEPRTHPGHDCPTGEQEKKYRRQEEVYCCGRDVGTFKVDTPSPQGSSPDDGVRKFCVSVSGTRSHKPPGPPAPPVPTEPLSLNAPCGRVGRGARGPSRRPSWSYCFRSCRRSP